jgi:pimeloyl-ACP methyl ester carboxylesterase
MRAACRRRAICAERRAVTTAAAMLGAVSKTVEICGQPTHYLEAGSGSPLVLIHGGGAGADSWGNWQDCLSLFARQFHVFAMDMIGFGKSAKPAADSYDYGQRQRNRHLAEFIDKLGLGPVGLIGNSMGGATALGVAIGRPELVRKLVLMGSAGLAISNPDPAPIKALAGYDFTLEGMRRIVSVLVGPHFRAGDAMVRYRYELTLQPGAREALQAIGQANRKEGLAYGEDEIRAVSAPTLVVGGKLDAIAVLARTYRFLELIPNSWGFVLPHCGHWVMVESPGEFAAITSAFLAADRFAVPGA